MTCNKAQWIVLFSAELARCSIPNAMEEAIAYVDGNPPDLLDLDPIAEAHDWVSFYLDAVDAYSINMRQ